MCTFQLRSTLPHWSEQIVNRISAILSTKTFQSHSSWRSPSQAVVQCMVIQSGSYPGWWTEWRLAHAINSTESQAMPPILSYHVWRRRPFWFPNWILANAEDISLKISAASQVSWWVRMSPRTQMSSKKTGLWVTWSCHHSCNLYLNWSIFCTVFADVIILLLHWEILLLLGRCLPRSLKLGNVDSEINI